jgi:hypothetical protein
LECFYVFIFKNKTKHLLSQYGTKGTKPKAQPGGLAAGDKSEG